MKKTNISSKIKKLPKNYRKITESVLANKFLFFAFSALALALFLVAFDISKNVFRIEKKSSKKQELIFERHYWNNIVKTYPDYRDGFFSLALIEYRLGNPEAAEIYLQKSFSIDPNFENGKELKSLLEK